MKREVISALVLILSLIGFTTGSSILVQEIDILPTTKSVGVPPTTFEEYNNFLEKLESGLATQIIFIIHKKFIQNSSSQKTELTNGVSIGGLNAQQVMRQTKPKGVSIGGVGYIAPAKIQITKKYIKNK